MGKKLTTSEFIKRGNIVHNFKYNYSKVNYINSTKKVIVICDKHGEFEQESNSHLQGKGCKKCLSENIGKLKRKTIIQFIEECNKIHNFKYDYSNVDYKNNKEKVEIICPIHGSFLIKPNDHITQKQGCGKCGGTKKLSLNDFIQKSNNKHNFKYDYSLITEYINNKQKVEIICPIHGCFTQNTKAHYDGNGCPSCKTSKLENEVYEKIKNWDIEILRNKTHEILKETKQHFDFFIPKYGIVIECNGRQHYEPVEVFGGEEGFKKTLVLDNLKKQKCIENNIILFEYPYFFNKTQKENLIKRIKNIINEKDTN
jgi:hypothetical protein